MLYQAGRSEAAASARCSGAVTGARQSSVPSIGGLRDQSRRRLQDRGSALGRQIRRACSRKLVNLLSTNTGTRYRAHTGPLWVKVMERRRKTLSLPSKSKSTAERRGGAETKPKRSSVIRLDQDLSFLEAGSPKESGTGEPAGFVLPEPTEDMVFESKLGPLPRRGQVLSCHFPKDEEPLQRGQGIPRPALVLGTVDGLFQQAAGLKQPHVWVIYGTTQIDQGDCEIVGGSLFVPRGEANLRENTAFRFRRQALISFDSRHFASSVRRRTPVMGALRRRSMEKMDKIYPFTLVLLPDSRRIVLLGLNVHVEGLDDFRPDADGQLKQHARRTHAPKTISSTSPPIAGHH